MNNMFPSISTSNMVNVSSSDIKSSREFLGRSISKFDFSCLLISKLMKVSTFGKFIGFVILMGSEKQMRWIHTGRIIAFMAYKHSIWYMSKMQYIGISMCRHSFFGRITKLSISVIDYCSNPIPAFVRRFFVGVQPKSFNIRDVLATLRFQSSISMRERSINNFFSTMFANAFVFHPNMVS